MKKRPIQHKHRDVKGVKISTPGWMRLKEFGDKPMNSIIKSGTASKKPIDIMCLHVYC